MKSLFHYISLHYGFMWRWGDETGVEFVLSQCFFHEFDPETGQWMTKRSSQLRRIVFTILLLLQHSLCLYFGNQEWTRWIGNYNRKSDAVGLFWRLSWFNVVATYTILHTLYYWSSATPDHRYLMSLAEEICREEGNNQPRFPSFRLSKRRRQQVRRIVTWTLRPMVFLYLTGILSIGKAHYSMAMVKYGWSLQLPIGLVWASAVVSWLHIALHSVMGAISMIVLVNMTFHSIMDQEIRDSDFSVEKVTVSFRDKITKSVEIMNSFRKCKDVLSPFFLVVAFRPAIVLGFQFGSVLLAIVRESKSPISLILSSGSNLAFWLVALMASSAYLHAKSKEYVRMLIFLSARLRKQSYISPDSDWHAAHHLRLNTIILGCRDRNTFRILGHDVTSILFVHAIMSVLSNVMMGIDLLKSQL